MTMPVGENYESDLRALAARVSSVHAPISRPELEKALGFSRYKTWALASEAMRRRWIDGTKRAGKNGWLYYPPWRKPETPVVEELHPPAAPPCPWWPVPPMARCHIGP